METIAGISIVAVIIGLVQVAKTLGLPTQFAPLASLFFGVGLAFLGSGISVTALMVGLVLGLTASGLWSGTKTLLDK